MTVTVTGFFLGNDNKNYITGIVQLPSVTPQFTFHTLHMRCCRPVLVLDISLSVGRSCKGLKSAKVLETATRSKNNESIVEGHRLRTVHIMGRTCSRLCHFFCEK